MLVKEKTECEYCGKEKKNMGVHLRFCELNPENKEPPSLKDPAVPFNPRLLAYREIILLLIPDFPKDKLENQSINDLNRFLTELPENCQTEMKRRFLDISP